MARLPAMMPVPGARGNTNVDTFKDEVATAIENNFKAGLKTEFTGLNFPKDAVTSTSNCVYSLVGDVTRRFGFDYENNFATTKINRSGNAINTFRWLNVGGDGLTQYMVLQVGSNLYFYSSTAATTSSPLSANKLPFTVDLTQFKAVGNTNNVAITECQFAEGNGYLFIYHKDLDPFYCQVSNGQLTTAKITLQIRDFSGLIEPGVPVNQRPGILTDPHQYNLENQGWTIASGWTCSSFSYNTITSVPTQLTFSVASGLSINTSDPTTFTLNYTYNVNNQAVSGTTTGGGTVISYSGTTLVVSITSIGTFINAGGYLGGTWTFSLAAVANLIGTWNTAMGNYPSNADVWWTFRNTKSVATVAGSVTTTIGSQTFDPATVAPTIPLSNAPAPQGHFILEAFNQNRSGVSGIGSINSLSTNVRPKTGAWFAGRVWFAGVDSSQLVNQGNIYYTWSESIYFSQIATDYSQFGMCYQAEDPTDLRLHDLLPDDGGVIVIQGSGSIYKLFPIQNGMLVFASNGVWFITGSQGIGFTANDYTVTKISSVRAQSSTSFIDVNGLPVFWNEEGIYMVAPGPQGLIVNPLTVGTILSFYNSIPVDSKRFARGSYNPITYIIQWLYRSTQETSVTDRYEYDSIMCFNISTQAFYTYSIPAGTPKIHSLKYVSSPGGSTAPAPTFKYITSATDGLGSYNFTFSEEKNTNYMDWQAFDGVGVNYTSTFTTGYSLFGQGIRLFQPNYIYMYSRNTIPTSYKIQGIWNFASSGLSGKFSTNEKATINLNNFGMTYKRHRVRGHGEALQIKISSVGNSPFDIMGWTIWAAQNASA